MKKTVGMVVFFLLIILDIFPTNFKFYSNSFSGYSGYAAANYLGTKETVNPQKESDSFMRHIIDTTHAHITRRLQKMSKQENYLLWQALKEYDYQEGEVYVVAITPQGAIEILNLLVVIINNGDSLNWYGGFYVSLDANVTK